MRAAPRRGAMAVEFALLLPVFLLLVLSLFDLGWLWSRQSGLDASVYAGCRRASLHDPGIADENLDFVLSFAESSIRSELDRRGLECAGCVVDAAAVTLAGERGVRCVVDLPHASPVGVLPVSTLSSLLTVRMEVQP